MRKRFILLMIVLFAGLFVITGCVKRESCSDSLFARDGRLISGHFYALDKPFRTDDTFIAEGYKITSYFTDADGNVFYITSRVPKDIDSTTMVTVILSYAVDDYNFYSTKKNIYNLACICKDDYIILPH